MGSDTYRVEVYSKGADRRGESMKKSFEEDLGIKAGAVITADVYAISGPKSEEEVKAIASELLSEQLVSTFHIGSKKHDASWVLEVAYKPGVQDPAELSAVKAIRDLGLAAESVKTSHKIIVSGIGEEAAGKIAGFVANSTIQDCICGYEEIAREKPVPKVVAEAGAADGIAVIDVIGADDNALMGLSRSNLLALNLSEMNAIKAYFKKRGRNPTDAELETIAQTWSEHCKHKTFNAGIEFMNMGEGSGEKEVISNLFKETIVAATGRIKKRLACISI